MSNSYLSLVRKINSKLVIYVVCILLPFVLLPLAFSPYKESKCAYVMLMMAAYWLLEPVPVPATALLPVVLFPLLGIVDSKEISLNYMKETFMMFIGGLIVAVAVEDCMLHERIALKVLLFVGTEIKWLMLGFMLTTMFLSMWISNTATTAMMIPIVEAVVSKISGIEKTNSLELVEKHDNSLTESKQVDDPDDSGASVEVLPDEKENTPSLSSSIKTALLLSTCYSANIGGTGTLTGTGANLVFKGMLEELYPGSDEITFATWMMYNVPGMILCVLIGWFYLWLVYIRCSKQNYNLLSKDSIKEVIMKRYTALGSLTCHEAEVMILFITLVCLWIFRDPKFVTGWADAIGSDAKIGDSVPAIAIAFLMFYLPSDIRNWNSRPILEWKTAQKKLPWGVIILAGGGFALADGTQRSGLSKWLGNKLSTLDMSPGAVVAVICFMTAMLTEIVTNTTTANILLPVFSQMAIGIGVNPLFLMLPVTVVCSYAFMLPVATPPNAIAFESGNMRTVEMARSGLVMNIVCCAVQLFMLNTLGVAMFDLTTFPEWANRSEVGNGDAVDLKELISNLTVAANSSVKT